MIMLKMNPLYPDAKMIRIAVDAIHRGELVIFPTETVYGLAADALNEEAVAKVFKAKNRPESEPLPVQVGSIDDVLKVATYLPERARDLAMKHWPGPLTLVLARNPGLPSALTAGRETVGVRIPDHPVALALLKMLGSPIVATSANVSGNPAPVSADDAIAEIGESVSVVLDSGVSRLGVASTVVDVSVVPPKVLRLGTIGVDELKAFLGDIEISE